MSNINANDLIYYSDNEGKIYSGGFSVNSIMIKEGLSPIMTLNNISKSNKNDNDNNDNVSNLFSDLVIPSWTLYYPKNNSKCTANYSDNNDYYTDDDETGYISDDLYEKLLGLVSISEKELKGGNTKTRKMKIKLNKNAKNNNKNTKKQKYSNK